MNKLKTVQIPEDLFYDLIKYHSLDMRDPELKLRIRSGLEEKLDKMAARTRYAKTIEAKKNDNP